MHLIVAFAAPLSPAGQQAAATLALPNLHQLLLRSSAGAVVAGDEYSLTPPHERAWGTALGWTAADGALPWAAHAAAADGVMVDDAPWGLLTPVHLDVGTDRVRLADPQALALDEAASRELFAIVSPLFESAGMRLAWGAPLRWYASHPMFGALRTASIDRVIGRNIDRWLPDQRQARLLLQLQNEVQMLLYAHDFNQRREAAGRACINSFWLSGCGPAQRAADDSLVTVDTSLRNAALDEDWVSWREAWRALDAGRIAAMMQPGSSNGAAPSLTLAGERQARRFDAKPLGWLRRLGLGGPRIDWSSLLQSL